MKRFAPMLCLLAGFIAGCDDLECCDLFDGSAPVELPQVCVTHRPLAALPADGRQSNYGPSCAHAAAVNVFNRCGMTDWGQWYRKTHYGPHYPDDTFHELDRLGLKVSQTRFKGDWSFLEQCAATGRWAVVSDVPGHARNFAGFDGNDVLIVDVNFPDKPLRFPKDKWRQMWLSCPSGSRNGGGYAWTLAYTPIPAPTH